MFVSKIVKLILVLLKSVSKVLKYKFGDLGFEFVKTRIK